MSNENENKSKNKKNKLLIAIIIFLLMLMIGGGFFVYTKYIKNGKPTTQQDTTNDTNESNDGGQIIKDYKFDSNGNPQSVKPPNIGMAIKSAIQGDASGHATMDIKNSGDIAIAPQVEFNGKTIYTSPTLQPGEAVEANLNFGELSVGEHEFNVLAVYQGGSGLSLKSKVVVQ